MNAKYEKYKSKGLVILGISNEASGLLDKFVEKYEVAFPVVSAPRAGDAYGIKGYPTYVLVSPDGRVLAKGRPSEAQIEDALRSVVMFPEIPGKGGKLAALRKACDKNDIASIAKQLSKLEGDSKLAQEDATHVAAVRKAFDKLLASAKSEVEGMAGPDYYAQLQRLTKIARDFKGLEVEPLAKKRIADFKADGTIKREIAALKMLDVIYKRFDPSKISSKKKIAKALQRLVKKYEGTHAAKKAQARLEKS